MGLRLLLCVLCEFFVNFVVKRVWFLTTKGAMGSRLLCVLLWVLCEPCGEKEYAIKL